MEHPKVAEMVNHLNKIHLEKINEAKVKQAITRKQLFAEGKLKVWNDGLTKNDDPRIAKSSERLRLLRIGKDPWNKKEIPPKEILAELYINQDQSLQEVATQFSTNQSTVMRWLEKSGIKRRKPISGRRGKELVCKDGDKVRSSGERIIDNWLFFNGIKHTYETIYAYSKHEKNERVEYKYVKPDFEIYTKESTVLIEFYGMENIKSYKERNVQKKKFYELQRSQFALKLIELYPKDISNLNKKLGFLIPIASKTQSIL